MLGTVDEITTISDAELQFENLKMAYLLDKIYYEITTTYLESMLDDVTTNGELTEHMIKELLSSSKDAAFESLFDLFSKDKDMALEIAKKLTKIEDSVELVDDFTDLLKYIFGDNSIISRILTRKSSLDELYASIINQRKQNSQTIVPETTSVAEPTSVIETSTVNTPPSNTESNNTFAFEPRLSAPDPSNSFYNSNLNSYVRSGWGMFQNGGNCTAYAYGRLLELGLINGNTGVFLHDAWSWWDDAVSNGFSYGSEPRCGAIASWSKAAWNGNYGHVAIVEAVNPDGSIIVSESHFNYALFKTQNLNQLNRPGFNGYIYLTPASDNAAAGATPVTEAPTTATEAPTTAPATSQSVEISESNSSDVALPSTYNVQWNLTEDGNALLTWDSVGYDYYTINILHDNTWETIGTTTESSYVVPAINESYFIEGNLNGTKYSNVWKNSVTILLNTLKEPESTTPTTISLPDVYNVTGYIENGYAVICWDNVGYDCYEVDILNDNAFEFLGITTECTYNTKVPISDGDSKTFLVIGYLPDGSHNVYPFKNKVELTN